MTASIPASRIVSVTPAVIGAGGTGLDLSGLLLTNSTRVPIGTTMTFKTPAAVAAFFGPASLEAGLAAKYFKGSTGALVTAGALLFAQYPAVAVAAYLRGAPMTGVTLAQLKTIAGTLEVHIDGADVMSTPIDLSTATSFSNAAETIATALGHPVTFDGVSGSFVVAGTVAGDAGAITVATGTAADGLRLSAATSAITSQGSDAGVPGDAMTTVTNYTQNFASFATTFKPSVADMLAFAAWNDAQTDRFLYVGWDNDPAAPTVQGAETFGAQLKALDYSGTFPFYDPSNGPSIAAFIMGVGASIDFGKVNGRQDLTFRAQVGLTAGVTDAGVADNLLANGYNFYGSYATANQPFVFLYDGRVSGPFGFADSYLDQIWMNNAFQLALMTLLTTAGNVGYNAVGYAKIELALQGTIDQAVAFGAIQAGVPLDPEQIAQVNALAGMDVATTLSQRGWYLQVIPASAAVRAARGSPGLIFFYVDGQSIHRLALNSVEIV